MKKIVMTLAAVLCCAMAMAALTACDKLEEAGMNDAGAFYSYRAQSHDYDYSDGAGPFDTAIRFSVGMDPIQGGADDKVIEACDACYEKLKQQPNRKKGKVFVFKIRHPDGKQKILKEYKV